MKLGRPGFGPAAPTRGAAQGQRVTFSGGAAPPGRLARCAPDGPRSNAWRLGARPAPRPDEKGRGQGDTHPNLRLEPPKTTVQSGRHSGATGAEGQGRAGEAGGAAADPTARPRSVRGAVSAGCTWGNFGPPRRLPGGQRRVRSPGPRGLCAPSLLLSGPGSPHLQLTLTLQYSERRARPGANRGSPGCRGLSNEAA